VAMNIGNKFKEKTSKGKKLINIYFSDTLRDILSLLRNKNHPQGKKEKEK